MEGDGEIYSASEKLGVGSPVECFDSGHTLPHKTMAFGTTLLNMAVWNAKP